MGNMKPPAGRARDARWGLLLLLLLLLPLHGELASLQSRTGRNRWMTWCAKLLRECMPVQASWLGWWRSLKVCERKRVYVSVSVDLTCCTTRGQGTERQCGACLVVRDWPLACVRGLGRYCVVSRTELQRRVNERTRMKYLCKECIDGMDVTAPPPAVDRMASSW